MKKNILVFGLLLCVAKAAAQSPYIYKVWEYAPAPGQFVNTLPEYEPGDTPNTMRLKAEEFIADNQRSLVALGGYGGYIVFSFDHMVENKPGQYDFQILGNAFYAEQTEGQGATEKGGSCEPGIVMVSYDANGNGRPDDPWYELAGSEYSSPNTIHDYSITYFRPDENKTKTPHPSDTHINDITYVRWEDNQHGEGYVWRNIYHAQPYYPQWLSDETLRFSGTRLADNYIDKSGDGTYYVQYAYPWGYADNHPNKEKDSKLNINWAVDSNGKPVNLPGAHFFKVYTGVNQQCGWIGETSTEITGAYDLHLYGGDTTDPHAYTNGIHAATALNNNEASEETFTTLSGQRVSQPGSHGIYIVKKNGKHMKVRL